MLSTNKNMGLVKDPNPELAKIEFLLIEINHLFANIILKIIIGE